MSDFRNKQTPKRPSRPTSSVDGFSRPRRNLSPSAMPGGTPAGTRVDNFKRPDGFTPQSNNRTVQSKVNSSAKDEPLLITKQPAFKRKRRLLGLLPPKKTQLDGAGRKKPMSRRRKIVLSIAGFLAVLLLIFGFLVFKGYINLNKILKGGGGAAALDTNVDPSKLKGEGDGRVNILLLGRGGEGHEGADLTDTIILVSIDPIAKEASLLSVPRDLYVPVPGYGSMKINAAFYTGKSSVLNKTYKQTPEVKKQAEEAGFKLMEQTVEKNLGVPVHYHAIVDFSGFQQAVNTVGGIDVNAPNAVTEQMRIDGKNYLLNVKPGQQHMDGFKALAYSRSRHTSARGDFDRSERQRLIIIALKQKILSAGTYSNPAKISSLLGNLGSHVQTNFSVNDLSRLYDLGKQIDQSKIMSIGLADPPNNYVTTSNIGGQSVVIPRSGAGNFKEIQSYLRNVLKDSFIRNENASISVFNGTNTPGLAGTKSDELKSYGYNITAVANAPTKTYTKTVIVDMRSGSKKYTKNYLEKRFGVSTVSTIPDPAIQPGTADFVIILGSDQANTQ
jgi:LCP family protein required for cell wall assembly